FFSNSQGPLRTMLGNWQINGAMLARSGVPFNVTTALDTANTGANTFGGLNRPNLVGQPQSACGALLVGCIDPSAYALPPAGVFVYGNAGRNLLRGPGLFELHCSAVKNFPI